MLKASHFSTQVDTVVFNGSDAEEDGENMENPELPDGWNHVFQVCCSTI